jgi:UDP-2,4-diacetamido-2,4,6-trideoxy-beta-L-altropyranose hydrolase
MNPVLPTMTITLGFRDIDINDCELLFEWRNIPEIISLSSNQRSVSWVEHISWFDKVISSPKHYVMLITEKQRPIGQVRFEMINEIIAEIGIYLIPSFVGQGRGSRLIRQASGLAQQKWPSLQKLHATIRRDNIRSIKAFESAGFKYGADNDTGESQKLICMTLDMDAFK